MQLGRNALFLEVLDGEKYAGIEVHVHVPGGTRGGKGEHQGDVHAAFREEGDDDGVLLGLLGRGGKRVGRGRLCGLIDGFGGKERLCRDFQYLTAAKGFRGKGVEPHDVLLRNLVLPGDVVEVFIPLPDMFLIPLGSRGFRSRGRGHLDSFFIRGGRCGDGRGRGYRNHYHGVFLQSGVGEGGICLHYVIDADAVGLGYGIERLLFEDDMGIINLAVQADLLLGNGNLRGDVVLGGDGDRSEGHQQQRGRQYGFSHHFPKFLKRLREGHKVVGETLP